MLNKAQVIGYLGADPDIRYLADGTAVGSLSIATTEKWKDKNGETKEKTEWHRVSVWAKTAENAGKYLKKGSLVYVEGRLETRKWQDKDGNDRYTTEIRCDTLRFLDRNGGGNRQPHPADNAGGEPAAPAPGRASSGGDDFDDDIPF